MSREKKPLSNLQFRRHGDILLRPNSGPMIPIRNTIIMISKNRQSSVCSQCTRQSEFLRSVQIHSVLRGEKVENNINSFISLSDDILLTKFKTLLRRKEMQNKQKDPGNFNEATYLFIPKYISLFYL